MPRYIYIKKPTLINEGIIGEYNILIKENRIIKISKSELSDFPLDTKIIDGKGLYLIPGLIDVHVHFREPGLSYKGDMSTESRAAIAGGVTTVIEMPNTNPPTISRKALENKLELASNNMLCNYGFFYGITNSNL